MAEVQVITAQFKVDDGPLQKLLNVLKKGGDEAKALEAAIEAAGVSIDDLGKAAQKTTKVADDGFKSLKQQLKEARNDATLLAQKFGENSVQALGAAKRVAELTEELDDFNQRVKALNPEAKFNAIQGALQGVFGGLQGVTGALQLFGEENKQVEEIARKLQGALNLAQGINSVLGLKDAFANLRIVLGLTAAGQTALATATTATTVATEGAAVATTTFGAALTATGIGAIVVALGGLITAYVALENQLAKDARALELLTKRQADFAAARKTFEITFNNVLEERLDILDFEIEKAQARGASEQEVLNLQLQRIEAERNALLAATRSGTLLDEAQESVNKRLRETNQQLELTKIKLAAVAKESLAANIDKAIDKFEELRKNQELQLNKTKEQGASEVELLTIRQENNKIYQQQLTAIAVQVKEEAKRNEIGKQINELKREEQSLAVQLENAIKNATVAELQRQQAVRETAAANAAGLKAQFNSEIAAQLAKIDKQTELNKKVNDVLAKDNADKIARDNVAEQDGLQQKIDLLNQYGIDVQELEVELALKKKNLRNSELKEFEENEKRKSDIVRGSLDVVTGSLLQFYQEDAARAYEEDADNLERQKERGLITEETYQARLRNLKRRQAEEQKKQAIFQATLDFSNALINALTIKPAAAIPATTILATIVAGANLARIVATPIPKFKHGTLNVSVGNMDSDGGSLAMLHPGEAVIPKQQNRLYGPSIKAIFKKQIKPEEINAFVQNKLSGKIENRVTADVDTYGLARAMKRNNGVNITNESSLARAIAREMSSTINHRRR